MGIETFAPTAVPNCVLFGLNGLGSPMGIETSEIVMTRADEPEAKWPGKPDGD